MKEHVDRILMFTDCQLWNTDTRRGYGSYCGDSLNKEYQEYKKKVNPNIKCYLFDLSSYGTVSFPKDEPSVCNISGWSDKVLKFIDIVEMDPKAQVKYVKEKY